MPSINVDCLRSQSTNGKAVSFFVSECATQRWRYPELGPTTSRCAIGRLRALVRVAETAWVVPRSILAKTVLPPVSASSDSFCQAKLQAGWSLLRSHSVGNACLPPQEFLAANPHADPALLALPRSGFGLQISRRGLGTRAGDSSKMETLSGDVQFLYLAGMGM